jgi:nitrous oxide reductase accessory protein NosL
MLINEPVHFLRGFAMPAIRVIVFILLSFILPSTSQSSPVTPGKTDKCPVCGMFVAKYQAFMAQIIFTDGSYALFDGAKDMFKYYLNLPKYNAAKNPSDIAFIYVTDYYSMTPVDGRVAWYVIGSDVFGPMGQEPIPFAVEADAREFMKDHTGKAVLSFTAVTPEIIKGLD